MYARPRHRCEGRYKSFMQSFVKVVDLIRADRQSLETFCGKGSRRIQFHLEHETWNILEPGTWGYLELYTGYPDCTFELAGIWWGMWSISCAPWDSMLTGWFNQGAGYRCLCFWVVGSLYLTLRLEGGDVVSCVPFVKWTMENHHLQNSRQIAVMQSQLDSVSILPVSFECLSQLAFEAVLSFLPLSEVGGDTSEWWWKQNTCLLC